ncbi:MAG: hypothetical protein PWP23_2046 [Candidatus Sumerlaeota bacterium]|nr:hypothetical protein [Candidatus Sumerlaeota bacterium]
MSNYVLDRAFSVEEPNGVARYRAVAGGANADGCVYPDGANAPGILGVTMHAQTRPGRAVTVRRLGIAPCEAASAFARGSRVCVADATGRIASITLPAALAGDPGSDASVLYELLIPESAGALTKINHAEAGQNTPLSATLSAGVLTITMGTDADGNIVTTAAELAAFINASPLTYRLLRATHGGNGTGVVSDGSISFDNWNSAFSAIGIAQQDSTGEGDIVDVLLTV